MKISSFVGNEVRKKIFVVFQSFDMIVLLIPDRVIDVVGVKRFIAIAADNTREHVSLARSSS